MLKNSDVNIMMVLKMAHFHKSTRPQWVKLRETVSQVTCNLYMTWVIGRITVHYLNHDIIYNAQHFGGD